MTFSPSLPLPHFLSSTPLPLPPAYSGAPAYAGGYTKKDPWTNFEWRQMPPQYQQNWLTLGYTLELWDGGREPASIRQLPASVCVRVCVRAAESGGDEASPRAS
jgi:hypothetical protein